MNISCAPLCKSPLYRLVCATAFCALIAGCSATPPNSAGNTANSAANTAQSTPATTDNSVSYVSSPQGLKGKLKQNYVDFSFSYPKAWELIEDGRSESAQNFVKVERGLKDATKGDFTLENFAVGYLSTTGNAAQDAVLYPKLVAQLSTQFKAGFPNYKKVSEGKTKIANLNAYEFRFQSKIAKTPRGPITLWGRAVLLPKPNTKKGVALIMLTSNLAPEIKSTQDVGEKGQLPSILKTFKFGK